jgi:hypothetical protein
MDYKKMDDTPNSPAGFVNLVNLSPPSGTYLPAGQQNSSIIIQPQNGELKKNSNLKIL